jgi:hypothetical protein
MHKKSADHISFGNGFEYFWAVDSSGKRVVVKATIANPIDPVTNQRIGARFEGTEAWFRHFGTNLSHSISENQGQ